MRPFEARWLIASGIGMLAALGFFTMTLKDTTIGGLILALFAAAWGYGLRDAKHCDLVIDEALEAEAGAVGPHQTRHKMPTPITAYSKEVPR